MTYSRQLGSKLISLLLALAMILALMPAVSLTASAAGAKYVLTADTPMYGSDGWAWDGQTLHFFGSGTYEVDSDYFSIESTKDGGAAVIDISGALTVNFTAYTSTFINSSCALDIKGAGKITVSAAYGYNRLFKSGGDITYAGGAICTDSELYLFANNLNSFTMTQGHIDAPNAYIEARSHTISNSYVAINSFNTANNYSDVINIDRSFVDTQTLLTTDKIRGLSITLNNSVLRSAADSSEFELGDNDIKKPQFSKVTNSVVYLTKVGSVDGLKLSSALTSQNAKESVDGGYVFCNKVITDADLSGGNLDGSKNADLARLSGAFYWSATNDYLIVKNVTVTGGILFSAPFSLQLYESTAANNAAIVILADKASPNIHVFDAKDCTIAAINESADSNSIDIQTWQDVDNCNVYSPSEGTIYAGFPLSNSNKWYIPNGTADVFPYGYNDPDYNPAYYDVHGSITAKAITATDKSLSIHGNICADTIKISNNITFEGSDDYSVSFGGVTGSGTIRPDDSDVAFACEKVSGSWGLLSDTFMGYDGGADKQLYLGRQVFNTLAADEATKTYDALTLSKGSSATISVPLTLPFEQWIFRHEILLFDEQNKPCVLDSVGITADFADGGNNSLNIVLNAGSDVAAGSYKLGYAMNGQGINKGQFIPLTLSDALSYTMEFGNDSSISWPYIDKDGNPQTFTGADYEKKIEADTWTWYGRRDRESGYGGSTLVLNDGFNFTTTADYGISKTKQTTFNIVVKGSCTVNAAVAAIYSGQNVILNINGADDDSTLSVNRGIVSDESLYISGVDIEANNVTSVIKAPAQIKPLLQSVKETFLYDCKITANDRWEGENVIYAPELKITRGVTLDLPASTIGAGLTYIAELESVDNILNGTAALTVEGSPYGEDNGAGTLKWKDAGMGMKLSTKPLEFIGTASDLIIADDTISADGDYCLFSGKEYRLDLSKLIGVDISGCQIAKDTTSGYSVKSQLVDGRQYFIVIPGRNATDSTANTTVTVTDSNRFYGSSMSLKLEVTLGRVVKADKVGFYHQGSYGSYSDPTDCYTASAAYNGKPLELQGTYPDAYYLVPSGENIEVTLIPNDGFRFEMVAYGDNTSTAMLNPSQDGTYVVSTDGTDKKFILSISPTYDKQYCKADISAELRRSLANGEIEAITLKYPDGRVKTLNGTLDEFPAYVLRNKEVTVSITPLTKSVLSINGAEPEYDSRTGAYSAELNVGKDTEITAELEDSANLCSLTIWHYNLSSADEKFTVTPAPINSLGQYRVGTECEIFANITEDKFIRDAKFNGAAVEPYKQTDDGCYYKVTTAAGENKFEVTYVDLSTLTVAKPEHGSVEFSGRLDYGRSFTTLADGTQVYSIGTTDTVTLTITPDKGYRLKSVKLDGDRAPAVTAENGVCTFEMDQSVSWTFTAEFEEIPAGNATVTVKCGANGMVTPSTADYPIGTKVTLTVTPDAGYQVKSAKLDGKNVSLTNGKYTFTVTADCEFSVEFEKKPSGGSGGGSSGGTVNGGSSGDYKPAINGREMTWEEIAKAIAALAKGSSTTIELNGSYEVPAEVIKAIADGDIGTTFTIDSRRSWFMDGAEITAPAAANLRVLTLGTLDAAGLRGTAGYKFSLYGTNNPAALTVAFSKAYAGRFANLYKMVDGKLVFAGSVKVNANGNAALTDIGDKGDYVIMLCEYSDRKGDVNNDGAVDIADALALLRDVFGVEEAKNTAMRDYNGDGKNDVSDARDLLMDVFHGKI